MTETTNWDPVAIAVHKALEDAGIETPCNFSYPIECVSKGPIERCFTDIMLELGLDLKDDSLENTPKRIAKMYSDEIFRGLDYRNFPKCTTVQNKMQVDELVCVKDIKIHSVCEHHFVPFLGSAKIAYIPKDKILGLSKLNRVADFFCRRPQVQERLTVQIAKALQVILEVEDIAVIINAEHLCVKLRGIQDQKSSTTTSCLKGRFKTNAELRHEFLSL